MVYLGKRPLWYVPVLPPLYRCTLSINSMVFAVSHVSNSVSPLLDMQVYLGKATNSTTQGSGGSFKNRKPIGEIGCCAPRMVEQKH